MFQKDDYILYRTTGVCRIADIGTPPDFSDSNSATSYYYLSPVHGSGVIYVPVNSSVYMRLVISREEAQSLLENASSISDEPMLSKDLKALTNYYKDLLQQHDCAALIQLIKGIYHKASLLEEAGKSLGKIDIQYRKQAEELLEQELSVSLGIPFEDTKNYITPYLI